MTDDVTLVNNFFEDNDDTAGAVSTIFSETKKTYLPDENLKKDVARLLSQNS